MSGVLPSYSFIAVFSIYSASLSQLNIKWHSSGPLDYILWASGVPRMQKLRPTLLKTESWQRSSLKAWGMLEDIATHAVPVAKYFFLVLISDTPVPSPPFSFLQILSLLVCCVSSMCAWKLVQFDTDISLPWYSRTAKLQALFYNILPSTAALFSYAIGPRKLSANEQFFVGAQTVVSLLQTTQIKQGVRVIYSRQQSLHQHK